MYYTEKILIVCDQADEPRIRKHIQREACLSGGQLFEILQIDSPTAKDRKTRIETLQLNNQEIDDFLDETGIGLVISTSNYIVNWQGLEESAIIDLSTSTKLLLKKIKALLEERNLHWLNTAKIEWKKSELGECSPEKWWEQFIRLGCRELGRNLLKLLKVITNRELREFYTLQESELDGLSVCHAYVKDSDRGSSSQTIAAMLSKMHGKGVIELELDNPAQWQQLDVDVIYVYEDGLWSGVELVKRIEAIGKSLTAYPLDISFVFKFAATTDIGLVAARAATRMLKMSNLNFHGMDNDNHFRFLNASFNFKSVFGISNDDVRKALDSAVTPYAFSFKDLWGEEIKESITACENIGTQLARPFLERRKREKNGLGPQDPVLISDEKAKEWSLGALGFGSTIVFESSIPKPVIPLMWLQGDVKFNNTTIAWRPLFLDARRTGAGVHPERI